MFPRPHFILSFLSVITFFLILIQKIHILRILFFLKKKRDERKEDSISGRFPQSLKSCSSNSLYNDEHIVQRGGVPLQEQKGKKSLARRLLGSAPSTSAVRRRRRRRPPAEGWVARGWRRG